MKVALMAVCLCLAMACGQKSPTASSLQATANSSDYLIGTGIYDITGPAAEIVMMGFAVGDQKTSGIHTRLRSRAYIVGDAQKRVVFVSADLGMMFQMVKLKVAEKIAQNPDLSRYYSEKNILLSATHTHGGPGGYSGYFLYDFTINGFIKRHFETIVNGIYLSILNAHNNLEPGKILVNEGTLDGVGGNRAEEAYNNNPAAERAQYAGNTDKTFTLLKFVTNRGEEIGMVNWFAVHTDSIGPDNRLITADNKGWSSYLFEKDQGTNYFAAKTFVGAFAQSNGGDVTPNIGFGQAPPDLTLSGNKSLGNAVLKQYQKARDLYDNASEEVTGSIDYRHEWVDMRKLVVDKEQTTTCAAGMGASFSAGSPFDNPSPAPLFPNGTTVDSLVWSENAGKTALSKILGGFFALIWTDTSDKNYQSCHAEKPILIPTGIAHVNINGPTMTPQIMPLQIIKIGSVALIAVPAEVTTMSGRRFRKAVVNELAPLGVRYGVVSSLANSYASYLATREEYAKQWYEGAATLFGPHEQAAFQQEFVKLSSAIVQGTEVAPGPMPDDITSKSVDLTAKVVLDDKPLNKKYGAVITQASSSYSLGETVSVQFWGAHPNNNYRTQDTFLVVEKLENDVYIPVRYDWDPDTTYRWERSGIANSKVTITWHTAGAEPGIYRIRHQGDHKSGWTGVIAPYDGVSEPFSLNN